MAAGRNIKGITVEIGGDTTGLQKALSGVNGEIRKTQSQLKDVERLLKLDPSNTELLSQKHRLLSESITGTKEKIETLKEAEKQAQQQFAEGKISQEQYDALKREIIATEEQLKNLENTVGSGSAKLAEMSEKFGAAGEKITNAGEKLLPVTAGIVGIGTASASAAMNFEDAMAKVSTIADDTEVPIGDLEEAIMQLSNQTGISSSEIAQNVYDAISAGQKTGDAVNFVSNSTKLAKAGYAEAGSALDILTTIMNAYGLEADKVTDVSDRLIQTQNLGKTTVAELSSAMGKVIPTAKAQGVELDTLCGVYAVMTSNGIATAETTTYVNSMLNELGKQGSVAAEAFAKGTEHIKEGGLTMAEAMERGWELTDVLSILDEQASESGTSIANMFSSAEAGKAANVLWDNAEKLNNAVEQMGESAGATETAFNKLQTNSNTIQITLNKLKNTAIELGQAIMEVLGPILEKVSEKISKLTEWFSGLSDSQKEMIVKIGMIVAALGPMLIIIGKISTGISSVLGIMSKASGIGGTITSIIGGIKTAVSGLFAFIVANPIIAVIAAVIAAVVVLYNKCEWFRDTVNAVWDAIKNAFSVAWEWIAGFFTETLPAAWQSVVSWIQGIPEWWSGIWQQVHDFFVDIWTAIVENPIISGIVTTIQDLWENCVSTLQGIWSGLSNIASGAWELLKNTILGPVLILIDLVTGDFENLGTDAKKIWENMRDAAGIIWEGIKTVIYNLVHGMITNVTTITKGFQETIKNIWESIKAVALEKWESIKQYVVDKAKNLKEQAVDAFKNMLSGIKSTLSNLGSIVENGFQSAIRFITSLPSKALQWGADFINGLANGIRNAIGNVTSAVSDVAGRIRSFLHFSVPDEGPLTEYESWMPDFMNGLAKGIEKSKSIVTDAVAGLSKDMTINANAMVENSGSLQNNAIVNIAAILTKYLPYLENGTTLVWETGEVAATLAPSMNRQLRRLAQEEAYL